LTAPRSITLVTGKLAEPFLKSVVGKKLNQIKNLSVNIIAVTNQFFGESVTVSGLLTGQDIYYSLQQEDTGEVIYLPENCINYDNLFLDDWTLEKLEQRIGKKVKVLNNNFMNIF